MRRIEQAQPPSPAHLSEAEKRLLASYRKADARRQSLLVGIGEMFAETWPAQKAPRRLRLVAPTKGK